MILQAFIGDDRRAALALIALDLILVREGGQQLRQLAVTIGAHVEIGLHALDVQPRGADVDKAVGVLIFLGRDVQQVVDLADVGLFRLRLRFGFRRRFRFGFGGRGRLGRGLLRAAVEAIFYRVAKVFDFLDGCLRLGAVFQRYLDVLLRGFRRACGECKVRYEALYLSKRIFVCDFDAEGFCVNERKIAEVVVKT